MTQGEAKTFYHAISQERALVVASKDQLPGLTEPSMFIPEGKGPGIWLSDEFALLLEQGYGETLVYQEIKLMQR